MSNLKVNAEMMKNQTFGVEIEMVGMGPQECVGIIQEYFNFKYVLTNSVRYIGNHCGNYQAYDNQGRAWNVMNDASIDSYNGACEMATPILTYKDIDELQEIVRLLRSKGASSSARYTCGVHIHVGINTTDGVNAHTPKSIRNLLNVMNSKQKLLRNAIGFTRSRNTYCNLVDSNLVNKLNSKKPQTWDELKDIHYNTLGGGTGHYSSSRYYMLNLHAIWDKKTIEFRCFEFHKNMHAGELKAYIQLCLAMSNYSKLVRYCKPGEIDSVDNEKYAMNSWLKNLGLIGDEFKTARKMLTKRLNGDTAYRTARQTNNLDDLELAE